MWCLISQPNSVIFEVRCDPKAIGQECLEKVSKKTFFIFIYYNLNVYCFIFKRPSNFIFMLAYNFEILNESDGVP